MRTTHEFATGPSPASWPRLQALGERLREAREIAEAPSSRLGYLATFYWARLASHTPFELPRLELPVTVVANGREICTRIRANGADAGLLRNVFLHREYEITPPLTDVRRILDLGANCGFASLFFSAWYPDAQILALEPMPGNAQICRRHFALNSVHGEVVQAACAVQDGTADLLVADHDGCHSLVPLHAWNKTLNVTTMSVPSLMSRQGWDSIDLFKVDIEGYEKELFNEAPAWLHRVRVIVGELHGDYDQVALQRDLAPFGFTVATLSTGYETTFIAKRDGS